MEYMQRSRLGDGEWEGGQWVVFREYEFVVQIFMSEEMIHRWLGQEHSSSLWPAEVDLCVGIRRSALLAL